MSLEQWQVNLLELLKGNSLNVIPAKDIDSILVFLNKFDADQDVYAARCAQIYGDPATTKEKILKLIDRTLLENEHDIFRIFGRESFSDKSRKKLKVRYQRLCRIFHPDHGLAEHHFLNQRMSIINSSYDLAEKHFDNPFVVVGEIPKRTKNFTTSTRAEDNVVKQVRSNSQNRKRRKTKNVTRRFSRRAISFLYRVDDFLRGPGSTAKQIFRVIAGLFVFIFLISVYQFVMSGVERRNFDSDVSVTKVTNLKGQVVSQPFEKELQTSEIEKILDEMLKENSTRDIKRIHSKNYKRSEYLVDDLNTSNTIEDTNNEPQESNFKDIKPKAIVKDEKSLLNSKKLELKVVKTKSEGVLLKQSGLQIENTENDLLVLPKEAQQTLFNLQQFYHQSQAKKVTSLFADDGLFLEFSGRVNIEKAMNQLFDKMQNQNLKFELVSKKQTGQWLILYGKMISEFQSNKTDIKVKKEESVEIMLFNSPGIGFLISSLKVSQ